MRTVLKHGSAITTQTAATSPSLTNFDPTTKGSVTAVGWFIITCILWAAGLVFLLRGIFHTPLPGEPKRGATIATGVLAGLIATGVFFGSGLTKVGANSVGIVTSFGAPHGIIDPGLHLLAPWDSVDAYSTRVQVTSRLADPSKGDVAGADCVQTNLNGGASACVDVTVRYVVDKKDAITLWSRYGDFTTVRDVFLRTAVNNAVKIVYGQYTPQQVVNGAPLPQIANALSGELSHQLSNSGLTLMAVSPGQVWLSAASQRRFDDVLNAQTDVQVAQQQLAKNQALAAANNVLSGSLSLNILSGQCIQVEQIVKAPVFNCLPGNGGPGIPLVTIPGH